MCEVNFLVEIIYLVHIILTKLQLFDIPFSVSPFAFFPIISLLDITDEPSANAITIHTSYHFCKYFADNLHFCLKKKDNS